MKRILLAQFTHETNSFSPKPADREAFRVFRWFEGQDMITKQRGVATDMGGFIDEMEKRGFVSPPDGQKPRKILITKQQYMEMNALSDDGKLNLNKQGAEPDYDEMYEEEDF